jgi:hypothetical protein
MEEAGERNPQGSEGEPTSTFYAILDRTSRIVDEDTLVLNVPIRVFITGDLAFYATVLGKEDMDKAHCHWCKLPSAQWQIYGHAPGPTWTLEELKRVAERERREGLPPLGHVPQHSQH